VSGDQKPRLARALRLIIILMTVLMLMESPAAAQRSALQGLDRQLFALVNAQKDNEALPLAVLALEMAKSVYGEIIRSAIASRLSGTVSPTPTAGRTC
jgi:hypothetical protein